MIALKCKNKSTLAPLHSLQVEGRNIHLAFYSCKVIKFTTLMTKTAMFLIRGSGNSHNKKKRQQQRHIASLIRELDRERTSLQTQEKKLIVELKTYAKEQQMDAARVVAKSIVRNRSAITKLHQLKSQLQAVSLRIAEVSSNQAMADAVKGTTRALGAMNRKALHNDTMARALKDFERQMFMSSEMNMGEIMEDYDETDDTMEDELVAQVFEELQLQDTVALSSLGGVGAIGEGKTKKEQVEDDEGDLLLQRLRQLQQE